MIRPDATILLSLVGAVLLLALATWFRDLTLEPVNSLKPPAVGGLLAGLTALGVHQQMHRLERLAVALVMAGTFLFARRNSSDRTAIEAFALGTLIGWFASLPLAFTSSEDPLLMTATLMAAGGLGWGTLALLEQQPAIPFLVRSALAISVCIVTTLMAPNIPDATGISSERLFQAVALLAPLMLFAAPFVRWRTIGSELRHESELGVYPEGEAARCAHPFRRFGRAGWRDRGTRRMFVRRSTQLAMQKRRARSLDAPAARLHHWGILRLRMEIADLLRMGQGTILDINGEVEELGSSDTIASDHSE